MGKIRISLLGGGVIGLAALGLCCLRHDDTVTPSTRDALPNPSAAATVRARVPSASHSMARKRASDMTTVGLPEIPLKHAHSLYVPVAEEAPANIPELDEALRAEGPNPQKERTLRESVLKVLKDDPAAAGVAVSCGQTLCRIEIDKPARTGMNWEQIDMSMRPFMDGEMIFQTRDEGETSHAYVYVSEIDSYLPVNNVDPTVLRGT